MVEPDWTSYDHFFSCVFWCSGTVAILANSFLIYLIYTRSPPSLYCYRVFLLNVAISDLVFAAVTTFAQIRIIPNKWAFAYVPLGPARLFGAETGYLAYCVQLHVLFYSFLSFPLSFGFRYYVLIRPMPKIARCIQLCVALWLIAFAQHILFIYSESPAGEIREYLARNKPQYNLSGWQISGNNMSTDPLTVVTLASIVLPMFPIYALVMYFYHKVHHFLNANNTKMSEGTIRGHKKLMQALTIQASLPILFIFPPITIYGLYHLELIDFTAIEYLVYVLFSFFPAFSPFVTIYFVRPYHTTARRLLMLRSRKMDYTPSQIDKLTRYSSPCFSAHSLQCWIDCDEDSPTYRQGLVLQQPPESLFW